MYPRPVQKSMLVVVDTDASLQRAVARVAASAGLEVVCCVTARAAFNACGALSPDCLVVAVSPSDHEFLAPGRPARPPGRGLRHAFGGPRRPRARRSCGFADTYPGSRSRRRRRPSEAHRDFRTGSPGQSVDENGSARGRTTRSVVRGGCLRCPYGRSRSRPGERCPAQARSEALERIASPRRSWLRFTRADDRPRRGALLGGRLGPRWLAPVDTLREALAWSGRRFELVPGPTPSGFRGSASLAELLRSLLAAPGAPPLGGRADDDLPEVSARRRSPSPHLDAAYPGATGSHHAAVTATSMPISGASPVRSSGRGLVESVQPGAKPDPRAERER